MRILMTTDTVGGVWTYSRQLTEGLLANGSSVTLVSMGRWPCRSQQVWADATAASYPGQFAYLPTDFKLEWMQDAAGCYDTSREFLLSCAEMCEAEIFHSNQFCYGALPLDIPKLIVAHSDVLSWSLACRGQLPPPSAWSLAYRDLVQMGLDNANLIAAPTEWMRQQITQLYKLTVPTAVIPNGRTLNAPTRNPRRMSAITCGRLWDEAKNIRLLDSVDASMPIFVAGDNTFESEHRDLNSERLHILGSLTESELQQRFAESAIYIATSQYEPFGLAPLEAVLAGCALVANDIPSLREVWGDTALYFSHNDPASLSRLLGELQHDPDRVHIAARSAAAHARKHFAAESMITRYLETYSRLLQQGTSRHAA